IRAGYDIIFEHPAPTPIIVMLYLHPSHRRTVRRGDYGADDRSDEFQHVGRGLPGRSLVPLPEA
nr:hypothetical protein [Candidatus Competibacter sp.]